jgi:hypothetical protein
MWETGIFLGVKSSTNEVIIGTQSGTWRTRTVRRLPEDERWSKEKFEQMVVHGTMQSMGKIPGQEAETVHPPPELRPLDEAEKNKVEESGEMKVPRSFRMRRADLEKYGYTARCPGCMAILRRTTMQGHTPACRERMSKELQGDARVKRAGERADMFFEKVIEREDKRRKIQEEGVQGEPAAAGATGSGLTHEERARGLLEQLRGEQPQEQDEPGRGDDENMDTGEQVLAEKRQHQEEEAEVEEEVREHKRIAIAMLEGLSLQEASLQDDFKQEVNMVGTGVVMHDMCQDESEVERDESERLQKEQCQHYDETTWQKLDPLKVEEGEAEEMSRFQKMKVYKYVDRQAAYADHEGIFVKVKWVRNVKGEKVRCRLVAQELAYGQRDDELFSGTPPLMVVKMLIALACLDPNLHVSIVDVKCAFLYGWARRKVYIELPSRDPESGKNLVGQLLKAMYGTRDAPQIWQEVVKKKMVSIGFVTSSLHAGVYRHANRMLIVVIHVDDFLSIGSRVDLLWLGAELQKDYDIKQAILGKQGEKQGKYLNRTITYQDWGWEFEGDAKHSKILLNEWNMEQCKEVDSPYGVDMEELGEPGEDEVLEGESASQVRRGIARIVYMGQDRPDLSVPGKLLAKVMANPTSRAVRALKRVIRYLKGKPRGSLQYRWYPGSSTTVMAMSDSDWAGDRTTRRSTSGGVLLLNNCLIHHWSKSQANVALSSGEAELNGCVKTVAEMVGLLELLVEVQHEYSSPVLKIDASACKGILLRRGVGRLKHLSTKQMWVQEAICTYGIVVEKIPRALNCADMLTHSLSYRMFSPILMQLGCRCYNPEQTSEPIGYTGLRRGVGSVQHYQLHSCSHFG